MNVKLMELVDALLQFAVAVGTLGLAFFSWRSIQSSDKQLKFIKKQTDLFLSQQQPKLKIQNRSFNLNKLILDLNNSGNVVAIDIAVSCSFHIRKPLSLSKGWLGKSQLYFPQIFERGTQRVTLNSDDGDAFTFNMKMKDKTVLVPSMLVVFPENNEYSNSLPAGFSRRFECEPRFLLKTKKSRFRETPDYDGKAILFEELRTLLMENNIEEISVFLSLWCKDEIQNVKHCGTIANFVIKLSCDENLENASKRGQRGSYPLDKDELKTAIKWEDYNLYIHGKYPDPEENN